MHCHAPPRFGTDDYKMVKNCNPPLRLSTEDWKLASLLTSEAAEAERQVAEHLHAESVRVKDEVNEVARRAHQDVDWGFRQRLADIQHWRDELSLKFLEINNEVEAETIYRRRLENGLASLRHVLDIDTQIISLRDCRVGVDLVHDDPQQNVIQEMKIVEGIQQILSRTIEFATEQIRLLRKTTFNLDKELKDKDKALEIDRFAHSLNVHRSEVHSQCQVIISDDSNVNELDWEEFTMRHKMNAQKTINASVQLRTQIDSLLRQAAEDVQQQICETNIAFEKRLIELIEVKEKYQGQHSDISVNIREMERLICSMTKIFEEQKSSVALAETRLNIRGNRPNLEMVKDAVQRSLILELHRLNESMAKINTKILQTKNALRNLLRNQLELEDAINVKMNSIGIDESKVMVLRKSILIQEF